MNVRATVGFGVFMLGLSGCEGAQTGQTPVPVVDEYVVSCDAAAAGAPSTSDENHIRFVEAERAGTVSAGCSAPQLQSPIGETVSAATPPTFEFTPTHADCGAAWRPAQRVPACVQPKSGRLKRLWTFVEPVLWGTAHAHCPAFTGENYLLQVRPGADQAPLYVAMLSTTAFTPDAETWRRALREVVGKTVEITLQRAVFFRGEIREGPFIQPAPYVFRVTP